MVGDGIPGVMDSVIISTGGRPVVLDTSCSQPISLVNSFLLVFQSCLRQVLLRRFFRSGYAGQSVAFDVRPGWANASE